jgi:hypothetical protein
MDPQPLVHPLSPRIKQRLPCREVTVNRPQRHASPLRDERDRHLLTRGIGHDLRRRLENAQTRLLHLLRAKRALVWTCGAHGTLKIIDVTSSCQEPVGA